MVLEKGTIAQRQLVAVGRGSRRFIGEARQNAVAIGGEIEITGHVDGDVISLGGSVKLADGAVVGGDVCALGGVVELGEGAEVRRPEPRLSQCAFGVSCSCSKGRLWACRRRLRW